MSDPSPVATWGGKREIESEETSYNGNHFRSRLEARWAVFFDKLGIGYDYEPELFNLGRAGSYLPDFKITHNLNQSHHADYCPYVEIKPEMSLLSDEEWAKIEAFGRKHDLIVIFGSPRMQEVDGHLEPDYKILFACNDFGHFFDVPGYFVICRCLKLIRVESDLTFAGCPICDTERAGIIDHPLLVDAYSAATTARFKTEVP